MTLAASAGCYFLASDDGDDSESDGTSPNNSDQNSSQGPSNETGESNESVQPEESNESRDSNESNESDGSIEPEKPDETNPNETENGTDIREEQKARRAEPVPESHYEITDTTSKETTEGITVGGKVKNRTSTPITYVDVDITFEDDVGGYLHTEVTTVRNIGANESKEFEASAYHQQIPGEVGKINVKVADAGRVPEDPKAA